MLVSEELREDRQSAYSWRKIETKGNCACNAALPRAVWSYYHVEIRPRSELNVIVGNEVAKLDTDNGTRNVTEKLMGIHRIKNRKLTHPRHEEEF
jgi:hypothetical protein